MIGAYYEIEDISGVSFCCPFQVWRQGSTLYPSLAFLIFPTPWCWDSRSVPLCLALFFKYSFIFYFFLMFLSVCACQYMGRWVPLPWHTCEVRRPPYMSVLASYLSEIYCSLQDMPDSLACELLGMSRLSPSFFCLHSSSEISGVYLV